MHEASVTEALLRLVLDKAASLGAQKIIKVFLVVGDLAGYVGESLQFYFDRYSKGTVAEGAQIAITRVEPRMRCTSCGELFARARFSFSCPSCGGEGEATKIGTEFYIASIEIESEGEILHE
ncbi:MAG: hydrogenase maturation nickel metallochaperone HypA [Spirochaetes bacterium]|nr:hydrogenase maturation nickel metallochaperone HypA [Spirochaetota bacterium]